MKTCNRDLRPRADRLLSDLPAARGRLQRQQGTTLTTVETRRESQGTLVQGRRTSTACDGGDQKRERKGERERDDRRERSSDKARRRIKESGGGRERADPRSSGRDREIASAKYKERERERMRDGDRGSE